MSSCDKATCLLSLIKLIIFLPSVWIESSACKLLQITGEFMFFQHHTDLPNNSEQIVVVHQHFLLMALASKLAMHGSSMGTLLKYIPEQVKYPLH